MSRGLVFSGRSVLKNRTPATFLTPTVLLQYQQIFVLKIAIIVIITW